MKIEGEDDHVSLVGKSYADFLVTNVGTGEKRMLSEELTGQGAVLCFYSSWCGGCPETVDVLDQMCADGKHRGFVKFIAININDAVDGRKMGIDRNWRALTHVYAKDPTEYEVQYIPHLCVVKGDGIVLKNFNDVSLETLDKDLEDIERAMRKAELARAK